MSITETNTKLCLSLSIHLFIHPKKNKSGNNCNNLTYNQQLIWIHIWLNSEDIVDNITALLLLSMTIIKYLQSEWMTCNSWLNRAASLCVEGISLFFFLISCTQYWLKKPVWSYISKVFVKYSSLKNRYSKSYKMLSSWLL